LGVHVDVHVLSFYEPAVELVAFDYMLIVYTLADGTEVLQPQTGNNNYLPGQIVMKFGEQLRSSVIREYAYSYISYDELKAQLKTGYKTDESESLAINGKKKAKSKRIPWTEENEGKFVETLYRELDKVSAKQKAALGEINHRIAEQESHVSNVVQRLQNMGPVDGDHRVANGDAPTEEEFMMLEEELSDVIADVHDLAKYVRLNYTGFQKIIKKHDVSWSLTSLQSPRTDTSTQETNRMAAQSSLC
jgi:SPX domain protein involved in polyphosphate accumulation